MGNRIQQESSNTGSGSSLSEGSGDLRHDSLGHYDNPMSHYDHPRSLPVEQSAIREQPGLEGGMGPGEDLEGYPTLELLMRKTEKITKKIQELQLSAHERKLSFYGPCADNIHSAVLEMLEVFPEKPSESVKCALHFLMTSAARLQVECKDLSSDPVEMTQQVIQYAYDIDKAVKQLVTLFK